MVTFKPTKLDTLDFESRHVFESFEHLQSVLDIMPLYNLLKGSNWVELFSILLH